MVERADAGAGGASRQGAAAPGPSSPAAPTASLSEAAAVPAEPFSAPQAAPEAAITAGFDHPIFLESIRRIRGWLGHTGLDPIQAEVLERLVHSSGDLSLAAELRFSPTACGRGLEALAAGAVILTDTAMAAAAVAPMARRTFGNRVCSVLDWAPTQAPLAGTRAAQGIDRALEELSDTGGSRSRPLVVLIGSAPTALERLLDLVWRPGARMQAPDLVIGMPVGFVGVAESKRHLAESQLPQIRLDGSRGGAGLVAAAANALLRHAWLARDQV